MAVNKVIFGGETVIDLTNDTVAANKMLSGTTAHDKAGNAITGTIVTATQATPSISVSSAGLITASATQSAGYVANGTKSATKQLTTQSAKTVTPTTSNQTAVASGRYTTGAITVKGDANLVAGNIKSGVTIFGVTGTHSGGEDLDAVIAEQAELIAELETALENAASGGGGSFETCTVTVSLDSSAMLGLTATTVDENGNLVVGYSGSLNSSDKRTSATLNNVLCGSMFDINVSMSVPLAVTSGGVTAVTKTNAYYASLSFMAPNESGAVGTVSISDDS